MGDGINNEVFQINKLFFIVLNCTKSQNYSNYYNVNNMIDKEIPFIEKIQLIYSNSNCSKNKCYGNNTIYNNLNIENVLSNKERWLDNFEDFEQFDLYGF